MSKYIINLNDKAKEVCEKYVNCELGDELSDYVNVTELAGAIASGTPITEGDLIMFRTLMTEIANKGLPFEEVLLLIDNAKTPTEGDCISRRVVKGLISGKSIPIKFEEEKRGEWKYSSGVLLSDAYKAIDTAPPVPQVTVFTENADEKAVASLKSELQNVLDSERPLGEWIEYNATGKKQYMCSKCSMEEKNPKIARYCYWCGAKMKGGAECGHL